ncbi:hypothetical protein [Treponema phagedenis]|uniref:hypothetical protein n=1 Tax=Treponema phagedenis TaxID=162 RepID=UPI000A480784|nr:hypothetical protein [Treponema phagedenis]
MQGEASAMMAGGFSIAMVNYSPLSSSERARTPVVPRSSDVLKAQPLSSAFKTRRYNFAMDGKIMPCGGSKQKRCFKAKVFAKL